MCQPQGGVNDGDTIDSSSGPSLEVDSDERDSAFGDNQSSISMSATSSVYNFRFENGRRYHAYAEGKYPVPNDEIEKDRLDLQHHAFRLTLDGRLYRAPIPKDVQHVLDIGTGTGIWAIEFADEHPSATVIGTDLSPIQPSAVPPNCSFLIDDCEQDWIYHNPFDYIHTRAMVAAVRNWPRFFEQAYTNLRPGGYLELQEITFPAMCMDKSLTPERSPLLRWSALFTEAASKGGLDATAPQKFAPLLRDAGFVDIHAKWYKWPVGRWAKGDKMKLLGRYVHADLMDWLPSSALALFTRVLKWSREEVELFLAECRRELREQKDRHFYAHVIIWYARKPEGSTTLVTHGGLVQDEEQLESDGDSNSGGETVEVANEPHKSADIQSLSTLVDPTAELSVVSPLPEKDKENVSEAPSSLNPNLADALEGSSLTPSTRGSSLTGESIADKGKE